MNKKVIALVILVVFVWGAIGYQIYAALFFEPDMPEVAVRRSKRQVDTTTQALVLSLNYPDPFLKSEKPAPTRTANPIVPRSQTASSRPAQVATPIVQWDVVIFQGSFVNQRLGTVLASLKIGSNEYTVKNGDLAEGFKVERVFKDSVLVSFGSQKKMIKKQP